MVEKALTKVTRTSKTTLEVEIWCCLFTCIDVLCFADRAGTQMRTNCSNKMQTTIFWFTLVTKSLGNCRLHPHSLPLHWKTTFACLTVSTTNPNVMVRWWAWFIYLGACQSCSDTEPSKFSPASGAALWSSSQSLNPTLQAKLHLNQRCCSSSLLEQMFKH